jgi:hypothetical protein
VKRLGPQETFAAPSVDLCRSASLRPGLVFQV